MKNIILILSLFTTLFSVSALYSQDVLSGLSALNSYQKIEQALKQGEITAADAHGYKVLAYFQDPQLPGQYQADADALDEEASDMLLQAAVGFLPKMTAELAAQVYSYMIPPPYKPRMVQKASNAIPLPEEIPSQDWMFIDDLTSEVRVWFQKDQASQHALAQKIRAYLRDTIIPEEKKLMGRAHPRDDLNQHSILVNLGLSRRQPNGGDGKLDVYLYALPPLTPGSRPPKAWVQGYSVPDVEGVGCPKGPSFMAVNLAWAQGATEKQLASTLAHEYFHVIQNTYDYQAACNEYNKLHEGTATYMKHHVYPKYNDEHDWFQFSQNGRLSLRDGAYETWPFYYFMLDSHGAHAMPKLYDNFKNSLAMEAVNKTLESGFKKQWLEYAVYEWNQEPLQDGFRQWDNYTVVPGRGTPDSQGKLPKIEVEKVTLNQDGQYRYEMDMELKPLTRDFYAFDLSGAGIRSVAIENPVMMNGRKVNVKAMVRRKGQTHFDEILWQDTQRSEYHYCLDKSAEEIDLIVLVIGNFQYQSSGSTYKMNPSFKATNQGCHGFKGKITATWQKQTADEKHLLEAVASDVVYLAGEHSKDGVFKNRFYTESAKVTYQYSGRMGKCTGQASGQMEVELGPEAIGMGHAPYNVAPEAWGQYQVGVRLPNPFFEVTFVCPPPDGGSFNVTLPVVINSSYARPQANHHGGSVVLEGKSEAQGWVFEWGFAPFRE